MPQPSTPMVLPRTASALLPAAGLARALGSGAAAGSWVVYMGQSLLFLLTLLLSLWGAFVIATRITRPVQVLVQQARLIAGGDYNLDFTIGKHGILWKLDRRTGRFLGLKETVFQNIFVGTAIVTLTMMSTRAIGPKCSRPVSEARASSAIHGPVECEAQPPLLTSVFFGLAPPNSTRTTSR